ncbi:MAG: hypothetical protein HQL26_08240 [Candidatus Omnitrophica bacterium]|nr:hypothetical protein [Candidatus Omnitrophota bacterium]
MVKKFLIIGVTLMSLAGMAWAQKMTLNAYYPAPKGTYKAMRLVPTLLGDLIPNSPEGTLQVLDNGASTIPQYTLDVSQGDDNKRINLTPWFERNHIAQLMNSASNVGIGTSGPGAKLEVKGTGTGSVLIGQVAGAGFEMFGGIGLAGSLSSTAYNFASSSSTTAGFRNLFINVPTGQMIRFRENNSTDNMTIAAGGNVGIGTTSPAQKLQVGDSKNTSSNIIRITNAGTSNVPELISYFASGSREWVSGAGGGAGKYIIGVGPANYTQAGVMASAKLTIDEKGNVGIGTTVPSATLDINGGINTPIGTSNDGKAGYFFGGDSSSGLFAVKGPVGDYQDFVLKTQGTTFLYADIRPGYDYKGVFNGNAARVGIGTTDPQSTLDVAGNIRVGTSSAEHPVCGSANEGAIRYYKPNTNPGVMQYCNGVEYVPMGSTQVIAKNVYKDIGNEDITLPNYPDGSTAEYSECVVGVNLKGINFDDYSDGDWKYLYAYAKSAANNNKANITCTFKWDSGQGRSSSVKKCDVNVICVK